MVAKYFVEDSNARNVDVFVDFLQNYFHILETKSRNEVLRISIHGQHQVITKTSAGFNVSPLLYTLYVSFMNSIEYSLDTPLEIYDGGKIRLRNEKNFHTNRKTRVKKRILERDGTDCFFCHKKMPNDDMSLEHLIPKKNGGTNHMDNLVLAHTVCNNMADTKSLSEKYTMRIKSLPWKKKLKYMVTGKF